MKTIKTVLRFYQKEFCEHRKSKIKTYCVRKELEPFLWVGRILHPPAPRKTALICWKILYSYALQPVKSAKCLSKLFGFYFTLLCVGGFGDM